MTRATPSRRVLLTVLAVALVLLAGVVVVDRLSRLPATVALRLSRSVGRPVTVRSVERRGSLLHPTFVLTDVVVAAPAWAGPTPLVRVARAEVRLPLLALLIGHVRPESLRLVGVHLHLVRDTHGRESWGGGKGGGSTPAIGSIAVPDAVIDFIDPWNKRSVTARFTVDDHGMRGEGTGLLDGAPLRIGGASGPISGAAAGKPWSFKLMVVTPTLSVRFDQLWDRPLAIEHFSAKVTAHGADLALLGPVLETSLPVTRPFALTARVRRDKPMWHVTDVAGRVGRSDVRGALDVRIGKRSRIDGALRFGQLDFSDFTSAATRAAGAARARALGPRAIPSSWIRLDHLHRLDLAVAVQAPRLIGDVKPLTSLTARVNLDHSMLRLDDLRLGLPHGAATGWLESDQRGRDPRFTAALSSDDARLEDFVTIAAQGPLAFRIRLTGVGDRIGDAVGRGDGTIGVYASGTLPRVDAAWLGEDAGRAMFADKAPVALRCAGARFQARAGIAWADPLAIDTALSVATGEGQLRLADERVMLRLHGLPKTNARIRLSAPLLIGGSFVQPRPDAAPRAKSLGGILKSLGGIFDPGPVAPDTDCAKLKATVLR